MFVIFSVIQYSLSSLLFYTTPSNIKFCPFTSSNSINNTLLDLSLALFFYLILKNIAHMYGVLTSTWLCNGMWYNTATSIVPLLQKYETLLILYRTLNFVIRIQIHTIMVYITKFIFLNLHINKHVSTPHRLYENPLWGHNCTACTDPTLRRIKIIYKAWEKMGVKSIAYYFIFLECSYISVMFSL
jgi:hypothetical protein